MRWPVYQRTRRDPICPVRRRAEGRDHPNGSESHGVSLLVESCAYFGNARRRAGRRCSSHGYAPIQVGSPILKSHGRGLYSVLIA